VPPGGAIEAASRHPVGGPQAGRQRLDWSGPSGLLHYRKLALLQRRRGWRPSRVHDFFNVPAWEDLPLFSQVCFVSAALGLVLYIVLVIRGRLFGGDKKKNSE